MKSLIILVPLLFLFSACSTTEETTKRNMERYKVVEKFKNEVDVSVEENVSWINLMPGSSAKFHVSGRLELLNNDDYSIEETDLKYIKIYQNGEELYFVLPKVIKEDTQNGKLFTYSTIRGLSLNDKLDIKRSVVFELVFVENKDELRYRINNVKIEEVH